MTEYYDNTMISTYRECPRKYFYRHVLHWKPKGTALPLIFGLSWHDAMDVVWKLAGTLESDTSILLQAYAKFEETWVREGGKHPDDMSLDDQAEMAPRTPGIAKEMLANYIQERRKLISEFTLLAIERPFVVPIYTKRDDILYIGRMDKIFEHRGKVIVGEHKTTSMYSIKAGFQQAFVDSFSPNSQIDGYLFAVRFLYGESAKSVWVDASLVHKKVHDAFKFIPVERQEEQLDSWLIDTLIWIDLIRKNIELVDPNNAQLTAFPKNTNSCYNFFKPCPYMNCCKSFSDPHLRDMPDTYVLEEWKPFDIIYKTDGEDSED